MEKLWNSSFDPNVDKNANIINVYYNLEGYDLMIESGNHGQNFLIKDLNDNTPLISLFYEFKEEFKK